MDSLEVMAFNGFQCPKNHHRSYKNRALLSKIRNPDQLAEFPLKKSYEWIRHVKKTQKKESSRA